MKNYKIKLILIIVIMGTFMLRVRAQTMPAKLIARDSVSFLNITLIDYHDHSRGILLGASTGKAVAVFGEPDASGPFYSEIDDEYLTLFKYKNAVLYFHNNELESFDITIGNSPFTVGRLNVLSVHTVADLRRLYPNIPVLKISHLPAKKTTGSANTMVPKNVKYYCSADIYKKGINLDSYFSITYIDGDTIHKVLGAMIGVK